MKVTEQPDGTVTVDTGKHAVTAKGSGIIWDGESIAVGSVAKAAPELRYTLNVIYPADKADVAVALDGHRDFASKEVVRKAAWDYMRNYREVGTYHADVTGQGMSKGAADLVESYIWPGPDWEPVEGFVVKSGDWLGGFIWTPDAWADIKAGKLGGVSVEGGAKRRKPTADAVANLRA